VSDVGNDWVSVGFAQKFTSGYSIPASNYGFIIAIGFKSDIAE
jgi:hypothetical protein